MSFSRAKRARNWPQRLGCLRHRLFGGKFATLQRLPAAVIHLRRHGLHDEDGEKKRQPQQDLVGGRGLRPQRLPQEVQHHGDPQEGRDGHYGGGQQGHQGEQYDHLHGTLSVFFPADMPNSERGSEVAPKAAWPADKPPECGPSSYGLLPAGTSRRGAALDQPTAARRGGHQ